MITTTIIKSLHTIIITTMIARTIATIMKVMITITITVTNENPPRHPAPQGSSSQRPFNPAIRLVNLIYQYKLNLTDLPKS